MSQEELGNGRYFQKFRFDNSRPPSDLDVVCHGRLIASKRPPEKFYNGWYPVRLQCSFPDHQTKPGAGKPSSTLGLKFRNYRIWCDICDHPDNQFPSLPDDSCCSNLTNTELSSVAPRFTERPRENVRRCHLNRVDTPWRYHDPRPWSSKESIPVDCRVHEFNWFKHQMDFDNTMKLAHKKYQVCPGLLGPLKSQPQPRSSQPPSLKPGCCRPEARSSLTKDQASAERVNITERVATPYSRSSPVSRSNKIAE